MITAYHRPQTLDDALRLLRRQSPRTLPLGGGTLLSHGQRDDIEVVDLQLLGLNMITERGNDVLVGATATLEQLLEYADCPEAMQTALRLEAPLNLRNSATVGGTLVVCDGHSSFAAVLLALDAELTLVAPETATQGLGDFLPMRGIGPTPLLITGVQFPRAARVEFEYVARTPADTPIVGVALAKWPSGRFRLAVCGYGDAPALALDGDGSQGIEAAASNVLHDATDRLGSAEYRMDVSATLARRCLARLEDST